jgi:hypothetical protein
MQFVIYCPARQRSSPALPSTTESQTDMEQSTELEQFRYLLREERREREAGRRAQKAEEDKQKAEEDKQKAEERAFRAEKKRNQTKITF